MWVHKKGKKDGQIIKATECFILVGSAMFGATFNLVTRVGLPYLLKYRKMVV